jgi:ATP-dependent RNA helicase RhlE
VQDIAQVINYDLPQIPEDFIHRVGRTGRAGGQGVASTLFEHHQRADIRQLERVLGIRIELKTADTYLARVQRPEREVRKAPQGSGYAARGTWCPPGEYFPRECQATAQWW